MGCGACWPGLPPGEAAAVRVIGDWFAFVRSLRGSGRGIHPTGARAGSVGVSAVRRILNPFSSRLATA
jgi:hypothetical protein